MDVSLIVARLEAECPTLAQVISAATGGSHTPLDTQAALYTLLQGTVAGEFYPLQLPERPAFPSMVYQMVSSSPGEFEGYQITHTDSYVLNLRGATYTEMLTIQDAIIAALEGQTIEVVDILHDYDQTEDLYRIHIELAYTFLSADSQALPAAYVYPLSRSADESAFDNQIRQRVEEQFAVLLVTADENIPALQDEVQAALLGWQQSAEHYEIEYSNGANLEGIGDLQLWRETYSDSFYMTEV